MAPEADEILPLGEGLVKELVGDLTATPFIDLGLGAPPALAKGEPELGVVAT